jgi:hypothetical protein
VQVRECFEVLEDLMGLPSEDYAFAMVCGGRTVSAFSFFVPNEGKIDNKRNCNKRSVRLGNSKGIALVGTTEQNFWHTHGHVFSLSGLRTQKASFEVLKKRNQC